MPMIQQFNEGFGASLFLRESYNNPNRIFPSIDAKFGIVSSFDFRYLFCRQVQNKVHHIRSLIPTSWPRLTSYTKRIEGCYLWRYSSGGIS